MSSPALADDPVGHSKHHTDFYNKQMIPGSKRSCCNNKDCRPVRYRHTARGIQVMVRGEWITPPASRVMMKETPDAGGHWCGVEEGLQGDGKPHTYCAIVPIPNV